jgi:hypothetical protein
MSMNALDTALVKLAASSTALEKHKPGIKDVEEAKKHAKAAAEILDSAHKLMLYGIYSVADAPADPFTDTADHTIYLPVVAEAPLAELPPLPDGLLAFDSWGEEEQMEIFSTRLAALDDRQDEALRGKDESFAPWDSAWDADRKDAFTRLLVAEARETPSMALPSDEERDAWLAQFAQPEAPAQDEFDLWSKEEREENFRLLFDALEENGIVEGLKRKSWTKARAEWQKAIDADAKDAFRRLTFAVYYRQTATWAIPDDAELQAHEDSQAMTEADEAALPHAAGEE